MKKFITISVCAAILIIGCKQLKEMQAVQQAIKTKNYKIALSNLEKLKAVLDTLQEKDQKKYYPMYYHYKVLALYADGKNKKSNYEVGMAFKDLEKYEKKIGIQKYTIPTKYVLDTMLKRIQKKGMQTYKSKNYATSSDAFYQIYMLQPKDTSFLDNAAITALQGKKYDKSIAYYEKLLKLGFTGIRQQFKGIDTKTGKEVFFANKMDMVFQLKLKKVKDTTTTLTESKVGNIVKNLALAYIAKGEKKQALQAIQNAKKMFPNDYMLIINEANIYYEFGDNEKFMAGLEKAKEIQPENPVLHYNIGVMLLNQTEDAQKKLNEFDKKHREKLKKIKNNRKNKKKIKTLKKNYQIQRTKKVNANKELLSKTKKSFQQAIKFKKDYKDAYYNLGVIFLREADPIVEEMNNNLQNFKKYDALMVKKKAVEKNALPYFEKAHELAPKDESIMKTLINLYESLEMEKQRKAMIKKRKSL